jgi:hypothetical protein
MMLVANVTNALRAMQLLSHTIEMDEISLHTYKKVLLNHAQITMN